MNYKYKPKHINYNYPIVTKINIKSLNPSNNLYFCNFEINDTIIIKKITEIYSINIKRLVYLMLEDIIELK